MLKSNPQTETTSSVSYLTLLAKTVPVEIRLSQFSGTTGIVELHMMIRPLSDAAFSTQLDWIWIAYRELMDSIGFDMSSTIFRRFMCNDLSSQMAILSEHTLSQQVNPDDVCAVSYVGQPPIAPRKVSLWAYHIIDPTGPLHKTQHDTSVVLHRGNLSHHWSTNLMYANATTSHCQTARIFADYNAYLLSHDMTLDVNLLRTWLFVKDIDIQYGGLVEARKLYFDTHGLNVSTHYIASTGIEGNHQHSQTFVSMDAYSVAGIQQEQLHYLKALSHLSPTHIYGVTFERGTSVSYSDRKHVFISGTASIDHNGTILHDGDVTKQLHRTLDNVQALLTEADALLTDIVVFVVYVRKLCDLEAVHNYMRDHFQHVPYEIVLAPVCRPGWLIEIEGIAIVSADNTAYPEY